MQSDVNGCSTCQVGEEQHETFKSHLGRKPVTRVQYDYRNHNGKLFTGVFKSLDEARSKRDEWLKLPENK